MKHQRKTKTARVMTITLAALLLLAGGTWYAFASRNTAQDAANQTNQAKKIYTDTAGVYELTVPAGWTVTVQSQGTDRPLPDPAKLSRAVSLTYPDAPTMSNEPTATWRNAMQIITTTTEGRQVGYGETFKDAEKKQLNGYELLTSRTSDRYGYVDERYLISNGRYDIFMSFRVRQDSSVGLGATAFDESDKLSDVLDVLYSVKFLK